MRRVPGNPSEALCWAVIANLSNNIPPPHPFEKGIPLKIGDVPYHPSVLRKVICIRAKFHPSQQLVFIGALVHPYASAKVES